MKPVIAALVALFILLQYQLWFSDGGLLTIHQLNQQISEQQQLNSQLDLRNKTLSADVMDLKKGNQAIAERAREDLGMIKNGETFYQIVPQQSDAKRS